MTNLFGVSQSHYQFQEEDGGQGAATLLGTEDTALSRNVASNSDIQLRIQCLEVGSGNIQGATNATWQLRRSINGGAFANVTTSSTGVRVNTSSQLVDGSTTTNRLTQPVGSSPQTGQQDDQDGAVVHTLPGNSHAEHVFGLTAVAADLNHGDVVTFELLYNGALFTTTQNGAYSVTPTLNIVKRKELAGTSAAASGSSASLTVTAGAAIR